MTGHSEMTANFVVLPDFFDIDGNKKEEDLQELPDLNPHLKGLIFLKIILF